jgi:hypothetical protein
MSVSRNDLAAFGLIYRELRAGSMPGSIAAMPWLDIRRAVANDREVLLHEMGVQRVLGGLVEERRFLGRGFQ